MLKKFISGSVRSFSKLSELLSETEEKKWKIINFYNIQSFKNGKIAKFGDVEIIKIRSFLVKKGFKYFIGYKDTKKLDHYVYFSQKRV